MTDTRFQRGELIAGRFEIAQAIRGGVGEVYLVVDKELNRPFAMKTLRARYAASPAFRDAFRREAETWISLERHPNIVPCEFLQSFNDLPFLVLEWVFGPDGGHADLGRRLRQARLDLTATIRLGIDVCRGLLHVAARVPGIVHRDLKPANILIGHNGLARITDFGLAQSAAVAGITTDEDEDDDADALQAAVAGTPRYMAPEQWTGGALDARTDVYAVGGVLFEALSGHSVHAGPTLDDFRRQHLSAAVSALDDRSAPGAVGAGLRDLLQRCLARTIDERPTVEELLGSLTQFHRDAVGSDPPSLDPHVMTARDWGNRGATFGALGRFDDALAAFARAIEVDPSYAYGRVGRAAVYLRLERYDDAFADLNRAIEQNSRLAPAYVNRAAVWLARNRHQEALADYNRAIDLELGPQPPGPRYPALPEAYLFRGQLLEQLGEPERALADYRAITTADPRHGRAWREQADLHMKDGRTEEADACYTKAIEADGDDAAMAYLGRAGLRYRRGEDDETVADASAAIDRKPDLTPAYLMRGHARRNLGTERFDFDLLEGAYSDYSRAIELAPELAELYISRARLLSDASREDAAIRDFNRALELDPSRLDARSERGMAYLDAGNSRDAITDFDDVLAADPTKAAVWKARANAHRREGAINQALSDFAQALARAEPWAELHVDFADLLHDLGRHDEALTHLDRAVAISPEFARTYRVRYKVNTALGREEEAAQDFEKGLDMRTYEIQLDEPGTPAGDRADPVDASAEDPDATVAQIPGDDSELQDMEARADALCAARRCAEALTVYDTLVSRSPSSAGILNKRGLCRGRCGHFADSLSDYSQALALDPNSAVAYNNRGVAYQRLNRPDDAIRDFDRAIAIAPDYAMAYINRGGAYAEKGEVDRGITDLTRGLELRPDDPTGYVDRAALYSRLDRTDDAVADLQTALRLDPGHGAAYVNLGVTLANRGDFTEGLALLDKATAMGVPEGKAAADTLRAHLESRKKKS